VSTGSGETQVGPSCRGPGTNVPARRRGGMPGGPGSPEWAPRTGYLAVLVLFCFGFLGVLAFLSISLLCRAGAARRRPDATGPRRSVPLARVAVGPMSPEDYQRDEHAGPTPVTVPIRVEMTPYGDRNRQGRGTNWREIGGAGAPRGRTRLGGNPVRTTRGLRQAASVRRPRASGGRERQAAASVRRPRASGGRERQPAATPVIAGMTSRPMRSSWSRSSPFMR
jgi:hypothetical protein